MFRQRRRTEGLGLLLLVGQLMRVGINHIPPTTLGTIFINVAIYLKVLDPYIRMYFRSPAIKNVCASTYSVWYQGDWARLALAAWFHLDDWHLYYNMVSFLWKGISLERRFGTAYFAYIIAVFSLLTNMTMVALNMALSDVLDDSSYVVSCAAGFSGVIFALKVLTTHYTPAGTQYVMGFPVPSRYACWAELLLIQLLVPRASFTGHLAGILIGLAFIKGPLKSILDIVPSILAPRQNFRGSGRSGRSSYTYTARTTAGRGQQHRDYTAGMNEDEQVQEATRASLRTGGQHDFNDYTAGMNEEEQVQEAIGASLRTGGQARPHHPSVPAYPHPSSSRPTYSATPSAPPYPYEQNSPHLYPDLRNIHEEQGQRSQAPRYPDEDELRRRRLARFDR